MVMDRNYRGIDLIRGSHLSYRERERDALSNELVYSLIQM